MNNSFSIAIHGGAGTIERQHMSNEKELAYRNALSLALNSAYKALESGQSAIDAVSLAVMHLEDSPLFNAGRGSVFTHDGRHEMDASIMEGKTQMAGAVARVSGIKNPILLARTIMTHSDHVLLSGQGAMEFAKIHNIPFEEENYFHDNLRFEQWQYAMNNDTTILDHTPLDEKKFGTVGAVALDRFGNISAATSTGGMTNKKFGRIGDSPLIGAGNYANNKTCAVSCTGSGEFFIRGVVAYDVSCLMEYKNFTLKQACQEVIHNRLLSIGGDGGLIAVDTQNNICLEFNTEGMYRAMKISNGEEEIAIYKEESN